jgi:hypothetical protein
MKLQALGVVGAASLLSIGITWSRYTSTTYPYSILQPSSFRHTVLTNTAQQKMDYFSPSLGSYVTNVSVYAVPGTHWQNEEAYLASIGAKNVRQVGWTKLAGARRAIISGDFVGLGARWTTEHVVFATHHLVWHLNMSYDVRYRKLRPIMLRMLNSFRLR